MNVRLIVFLLILCLMTQPLSAMKKKRASFVNDSKSKKPIAFIVDDFEDGTYVKDPEWWRFGNLYLAISSNDKTGKKKYIGERSLRLQGISEQWYVGGSGVYLGKDLLDYNAIKLVIYSKNKDAGILKIELYDDDNGNWNIDLDRSGTKPVHDDLFAHHIMIDWEGWQVVTIPFSSLQDTNPTVGDNIWNPYQVKGSGGLIQLQLVAFTNKSKKGEVDLLIDTIKIVRIE